MTLCRHPHALLRIIAVGSTALGAATYPPLLPLYELWPMTQLLERYPPMILLPPLVLLCVAVPANIICIWRRQRVGIICMIVTILTLVLPAWVIWC